MYGKDPEDTLYGFEDEISAQYFSGFENKDVAFFHKASKTVIEADLLFNFPPTEQYSKSKERYIVSQSLNMLKVFADEELCSGKTWVPLVGSIAPGSWAHKQLIGGLAKDIKTNSRDAKVVESWDFDTIIPCHGVRETQVLR